MTRRRVDFWLAELSWIALIAVGLLVHQWSTLASDTLLSLAFIIGLVPPVYYLWAIRRPERTPATLPDRPGIRKVNRSRQ